MQPRLSRNGANKIRELRALAIEPTDDELVLLHELGKRVDNPSDSERLDLIGRPVKAGNVWLWPLTVMSSIWYADRALPWFERNPLQCSYALAFALAHGRGLPVPDLTKRPWSESIARRLTGIQDGRVLSDIADPHEAAALVARWAQRLECTREELEAAMDAVLQADDMEADNAEDRERHEASIDWGRIVNELAMLTNTHPEYWMTRTSLDATAHAYVVAKAVEQARRGFSAAKMLEPIDFALRDLQRAFAMIKTRYEPKL